MAKALVHSILAALFIFVRYTTAFPSDIHYMMSKNESLAFFGSEQPDPEYDVFPMSLPGLRRIRKTNAAIECTLNINDEEIHLNLKPTEHCLANKYIPVWSAVSDHDAYKKINYKPLPTAMSGIGEFTMYQDVENSASLVVYEDSTEKIVIEGFIRSEYTIKSLPKHFNGDLLEEVDDITEIPNVIGGAIESNKDAGFYTVIRNPEVPEIDLSFENDESIEWTERESDEESASHERETKAPTTVHALLENHESADPAEPKINDEQRDHERPKQYADQTLYPEMLIVLDHSIVRHRTKTQALRFTLTFWNAVDLMYKKLGKPKMHLNIAGIIIAGDDTATPYIAKNTSVTVIGDYESVPSRMEKYFYTESVRFPTKRHDIIIAMTAMKFCTGDIEVCGGRESIPGSVNGVSVCSSELGGKKTHSKTMIVHNNGIFGPRESFFLKDENTKSLPVFLLGSNNAECLRNEPLSIKKVDEILPGRWLSMRGQCLNEGYAKSCRYGHGFGKCEVKGCKTKSSDKCKRTNEVPLPGSQCGHSKYCNKKNQCVYKL